MSRYNGTFKYKAAQNGGRDPKTGFAISSGTPTDWIAGCECQIDRSIPAKRVIGANGKEYSYTYDVFIPKYFSGSLNEGMRFQVTSEDGKVDEFTIKGIDSLNRKYIEVWG